MITTRSKPRSPGACSNRPKRGFALITVLLFAAVSLMAVASSLTWISTNARQTQRNNTYFTAVAAAEAATEKAVAAMTYDFQTQGESEVYQRLEQYRQNVPKTSESSLWNEFTFSNGKGTSGKTHIDRITSWGYTNLSSQYQGLMGMASTYRIISNAQKKDYTGNVAAGVMQTIQLASVPVFQFAIFYTLDLEINPGPNMKINGRVHSNSTIYTEPHNTLTFEDHVTAVGKILDYKSPLDPSSRPEGTIVFEAEHDAFASALTLPIGTNNTPSAVREVVEVPPSGEDPASAMGKERYYNKVDMIVKVKPSSVTVTSGRYNDFGTTISWNTAKAFISTNASFYNKREGKTVKAIDINVAALSNWSKAGNAITDNLNRDISSIYVIDQRSHSSSSQPGVRLINGQTLPPLGLTVASPNPVYVKGHYNAPSSALGTDNTKQTKPASIVADAITILSTDWSDSDSSKSLSDRTAKSTTVNAAFLAGIVQSDGANYSGGVENFPRFLENWSDDTFTYNGSMVVMYESKFAKAPWGGSDVYNPPTRKWSFDKNFKDATKLPPCTPQFLVLIRGEWASLPPNTVP